jgi:uncharacterized protein
MLKILLLIFVFTLVYFIFFRKKGEITTKTAEKKEEKETGEELIACSQCGTLVSDKEILISNGKYFCSKECIEKQ